MQNAPQLENNTRCGAYPSPRPLHIYDLSITTTGFVVLSYFDN